MRKTVIVLLSLVLILTLVLPALADTQVDVYDHNKRLTKSVVFALGVKEYFVDGQTPGTRMDVAPFIENGRTYVPVRYLSNALGVTDENIGWDERARLVTLAEPGFPKVELTIGSKTIKSDDQARQMDVAPLIRDARTFLPARFVAEALGYQVDWDAANQVVICWPQGIEKPDVTQVIDHLKGETPDVPANVIDITSRGEPIPAELIKYNSPDWKINYITVDDLKKNDYQIGDIRVIDLRVERDYIYVKQEQKNWSPIRVALWEGGDVYRSREAHRLLDPAPVFEVQFSVVNDRADQYAGWPTVDISKVKYIFLERGTNILAVENPLYEGGN